MPFSERTFTVRDILRHEAEALSNHGPARAEPKEPESDLETFTRLHNFGAGLCRVKQWPVDEDPCAWGCRNEALLLDEPIHSPARWNVKEEYRSQFNRLLLPIDYTGMSGFRHSDRGKEGQFLVVLNKIFRRLTTVALVFLIQLWRRDPEHSSHPDYHVPFEALHNLAVQQISTSEHMSVPNHEVAIMLPLQHSRHDGYKPMVLGCAQPTGFAEKIYPTNEGGCKTADEVLSSVLDQAEQDTKNLFMRFGNDWQLVAIGQIIKMSHFASLSASHMGLSTSIWGYLRFFLQIETNDGRAPILYITRNVAADTAWSDDSRRDHSSNFKLLCHIYYLIIMALLQTQGPSILPPDIRENESLLNFSFPTSNNPSFTRCRFLFKLAVRWISSYFRTVSFGLLATLWELALHYFGTSVLESVGQLRIQTIDRKLERISSGGLIRGSKCLWLRFDSWEVRDVTEIGINRRACLVLKVFHTHPMFESELRAYLALQEAGVTLVPQLLGVFNVPGTKGALLLTMVGQVAKEPFDFHDRCHLHETIKLIHTANIHHHDLRIDNIVRGADGQLRIIDFGHSSRADECTAAESCSDQIFLKLWAK